MASSTKASLSLLWPLLLGLQLQEGLWAKEEMTQAHGRQFSWHWGASLLSADRVDLFANVFAPSGTPLQVNGTQLRAPLFPPSSRCFDILRKETPQNVEVSTTGRQKEKNAQGCQLWSQSAHVHIPVAPPSMGLPVDCQPVFIYRGGVITAPISPGED